MIAMVTSLAPIIAQILFYVMKQKGIDKENERKFLEAVQSINALRSTNMKKAYDKTRATMSDAVDEYNKTTT